MTRKTRDAEHIFLTDSKKRKSVIFELVKVFGLRCWYCGIKLNESEVCIDHIRPISNGGNSDIDNLALSCKQCNSHKFYYSIEEFLKYLAYIRTGNFNCLILDRLSMDLDCVTRDILHKYFY
jgi:5-methylcytosine-specific restriction endonuclease McrA